MKKETKIEIIEEIKKFGEGSKGLVSCGFFKAGKNENEGETDWIRDQLEIALQILLNNGYKVILYPDPEHLDEENGKECEKFANVFQDPNIIWIDNIESADELCSLIVTCDLSISMSKSGQRMSSALAKPFLYIASLQEPTNSRIAPDMEEYCLSGKDINAGRILEKISTIEANYEQIQEKLKQTVSKFSPTQSNFFINSIKPEEEVHDPKKKFEMAEKAVNSSDDETALKYYSELSDHSPFAHLASFRLGEIYNRRKETSKSVYFHKRALELDPALASKITDKTHRMHNYIYSKAKEKHTDKCPLCSGEGLPHSCYNVMTNLDFFEGFNPIRVWMYCENCHHIFAGNYPENLGEVLADSSEETYLSPKIQLIPFISNVINSIRQYASGNRLLEVGLGAGEMTAVAREYGFSVTGVEIRPAYADLVRKMLDIPVFCTDFMKFHSEESFDVIILGDVLEHLPDPVGFMDKVNSLLSDKGVVWISTPNFDSAFSSIMKDKDPMWRVCEHINYFSYKSLNRLLERYHFRVIDYRCSSRFNGSMEVISVKN
jgi:2-polyprenyl-3-methyl-5-hydroxy-6-metoxy-1,4-benzoquinol methylase